MPTAEFPRIHDVTGEIRCRRAFDRSMQWDPDLPADLVERIWRSPHALLADSVKLQEKLRCTIARVDHPNGVFTWKRHNWGTLRRTLKKTFAQSPAKKSWLDSRFLHAAGIPTPRTRACFDKRVGPFQVCSYLLTDYVVGTSLYRLMRFERPSPQFVEQLAQQVATIWQQLDELGVWHNDFKTENFLVDREGKVWLIDFERMRRYRDRSRLRERQVKDARDFLHPRNWRSDPAAAEVFRQAILGTAAAKATLAGPLGANHPLNRKTVATNSPNHLVTVLIPCHNAADTIVGCLESVRDMADEILVVDAGSTDDTLQLVREFGGCRIVERGAVDGSVIPITYDAAFEIWVASHATHPWILRLQADEQLNGELSRQVQDLLANEPSQAGFRIGRTVYLRSRRLRYGSLQDEPSIRLYRKNAAQYEFRNGRVEVRIPNGKIGELNSRLVYEACPNIRHCLREMIRLATRAAEFTQKQGVPATRHSASWRAPAAFLQSYILRWGWLDGRAGLNAGLLAALSVYLREAIRCELQHPSHAHSSLVHDHWRPLKVFTAEEQSPDAITAENHSIRSAA